MKPLDIVETPKGSIAIVTDVQYGECSITFIKKVWEYDKNAWWSASSLKVIHSLPLLLATTMCHPFNNDARKEAEKIFSIEQI